MNYFQAHVEAFVSVYEVRKLTKIRKTLLKAYQLCYNLANIMGLPETKN